MVVTLGAMLSLLLPLPCSPCTYTGLLHTLYGLGMLAR